MNETEFFDQMKTGKTLAEKIRHYEEKIVRRILGKCGAGAEFVRRAKGQAWNQGWCSWMNDNTTCPYAIHVTRVFNFNLLEILHAKKNHPLRNEWRFARENWPSPSHLAVVFHVAKFSEWVMLDMVDSPFIKHGLFTIVGEELVMLTPLSQFEVLLANQWDASEV